MAAVKMEGVNNVEFHAVHWTRKQKNDGKPCPIITRFVNCERTDDLWYWWKDLANSPNHRHAILVLDYMHETAKEQKKLANTLRNARRMNLALAYIKNRHIFVQGNSPLKALALSLYCLAHRNSYESIGLVFNVGRSTVLDTVQDVVEALFYLRNDYIKFPSTEAETWRCIETFQNVSDLPNIVGATDGSHIRIAAPPDSAVDYFSRYQQHDFIVQAIVDGRKRFLDFASGFPGSM